MPAIIDKRTLFNEYWLFRCLSEPEAERLLRYARMEHHPANRRLFRQGESDHSLIAVLGGRIKLSRHSADGREVILGIVGAGEVIGEMALLTGQARSADATAMERCEILIIERRDFLPVLENNAGLCIKLLEMICGRLQRTNMQLEDMVFLDRSAKLARALLRLADEHGKETAAGLEIELKLSQRELGNLVGLTRESMNKQLADWRKQGVVSVDDGLITIRDRDALEELIVP